MLDSCFVVACFVVGDPSIMAYLAYLLNHPCFVLVAFDSAYLVVLAFSGLAYLASGYPFVAVASDHHGAFAVLPFILDGVVVCYLHFDCNLCCLVVLVHLSFVSRSG